MYGLKTIEPRPWYEDTEAARWYYSVRIRLLIASPAQHLAYRGFLAVHEYAYAVYFGSEPYHNNCRDIEYGQRDDTLRGFDTEGQSSHHHHRRSERHHRHCNSHTRIGIGYDAHTEYEAKYDGDHS